MMLYIESTLQLSLRDREIDAMRQIIRLAHERLTSSPAVQLHGCPLKRQAGLVGPELSLVNEIVERMACELGVPLQPYVAYPIATT